MHSGILSPKQVLSMLQNRRQNAASDKPCYPYHFVAFPLNFHNLNIDFSYFLEHVRKSAEFSLKDMVQHLFTRLPSFGDVLNLSSHLRKIKMNKGSMDGTVNSTDETPSQIASPTNEEKVVEDAISDLPSPSPSKTANIVDMQGQIHQVEEEQDSGSSPDVEPKG